MYMTGGALIMASIACIACPGLFYRNSKKMTLLVVLLIMLYINELIKYYA